MQPLRLDSLTQHQIRKIFKKLLFADLDINDDDRSVNALCRSYADWYFANFTKFHIDSKLYCGINFTLHKACEFL